LGSLFLAVALIICARWFFRSDLSDAVAEALRRLEFEAYNLEGGTQAWGDHYVLRTVEETPVAEAPATGSANLEEAAERWRRAFIEALDDDLNVSDALGATFTMVREANLALDGADRFPATGLEAVRAALNDFDSVFGVLSLREREETADSADLEEWIEERIGARAAAREAGRSS